MKLILIFFSAAFISCNNKEFSGKDIGQPIDSLNNVKVYYNGGFSQIHGRNVAADGYNLGLKYQCVEFVKRYYYVHLNHKMPNSYGHAKYFFDKRVKDGGFNRNRDLRQYTNMSSTKPEVNDLVIFDGSSFNNYGHVAIVSKVKAYNIEVIQQNVGTKTRASFKLRKVGDKWRIESKQALGWLRKE